MISVARKKADPPIPHPMSRTLKTISKYYRLRYAVASSEIKPEPGKKSELKIIFQPRIIVRPALIIAFVDGSQGQITELLVAEAVRIP